MPCNGRYLYVTDCQYVIDGVGKGRAAMTNGWAPHPGIWRDISDKLADIGTKVVLVKVKSHRSLGSANGASDAFLIGGNMLADLLAKKGAYCHPKDDAAYLDLKHASALTQTVGRYISQAACLFAEENQQEKLVRRLCDRDVGNGIGAWLAGAHISLY